MKLMIVGHARHGKDTVAEILQKRYKMKFVSSSWWCAESVIMPAMPGAYKTVQECFDDRVNHRAGWHKLIAEFCEQDLSVMGRAILSMNDIYVGCRAFREFEALKACGAFDFSIWVDASRRLPPEDEKSMGLFPWQADYILDNNGTLQQMEEGLNRLMKVLGRRNSFAH